MSEDGFHFHDGDRIKIEGKHYVIAGLQSGGFTLLDADGPGWMDADMAEDEPKRHPLALPLLPKEDQ